MKILESPYGVKANPLRVKSGVPIIEKNWVPRFPYDRSDPENMWREKTNHNAIYGKILHLHKWVEPDLTTLKLKEESDEFWNKINDSVVQRLDITFKFKADTVYQRAAFLDTLHSTPHSGYYPQIDLTEHGIDSVAKKWHLDYLIKGK